MGGSDSLRVYLMTSPFPAELTVGSYIEEKTAAYAALPLFQAFREDKIPLERFPDFFKEQFMTARCFQDLIWATTEITDGPYRAFAVAHRHRDSGHYRWMEKDLAAFGITPMTSEDWYRLEWLPTRIQMARILARCHRAGDEEKMVILASLESAGAVTLGTLNAYVKRHCLEDTSLYLGEAHVGIEEEQVDEIYHVAPDLMGSSDADYFELVDLVFDALTIIFSEGGQRYYREFL